MVHGGKAGFATGGGQNLAALAICFTALLAAFYACAIEDSTVAKAPEPPAASHAPIRQQAQEAIPELPADSDKEARPAAASSEEGQRDTRTAPAVASGTLQDQWGIQVLALRRTAGNNMLDFRYRVLDAQKAAPLFDRKIKPYLLDEATGSKLLVPSPPKIGPLRATEPPKANKNYFILFANPGQCLKKDSLATLIIGDLKVEHLVVE